MRHGWLSLRKELGTLYEKDVPLSTKIWILGETGCNIVPSRGNPGKKVTTEKK
jgi:hypothetical protein